MKYEYTSAYETPVYLSISAYDLGRLIKILEATTAEESTKYFLSQTIRTMNGALTEACNAMINEGEGIKRMLTEKENKNA